MWPWSRRRGDGSRCQRSAGTAGGEASVLRGVLGGRELAGDVALLELLRLGAEFAASARSRPATARSKVARDKWSRASACRSK